MTKGTEIREREGMTSKTGERRMVTLRDDDGNVVLKVVADVEGPLAVHLSGKKTFVERGDMWHHEELSSITHVKSGLSIAFCETRDAEAIRAAYIASDIDWGFASIREISEEAAQKMFEIVKEHITSRRKARRDAWRRARLEP